MQNQSTFDAAAPTQSTEGPGLVDQDPTQAAGQDVATGDAAGPLTGHWDGAPLQWVNDVPTTVEGSAADSASDAGAPNPDYTLDECCEDLRPTAP